MRSLLIALFFVYGSTAQEIDFKGSVIAADTNEPIPFVNLSFLNTFKGTSTNEDGVFNMELAKEYLNTTIHISSLGYKDTIVSAQWLYTKKKIALLTDSFALEEVVLTENLTDSYFLNPVASRSITSGFTSSSTPWVLALYFPNEEEGERIASSITVYFQKDKKFKRDIAKFRLRLYSVDPVTKEPNVDLLRKSIVLETQMNKEFVRIDIADFGVKFPKDGLFIGLEWLFVPYNWYTETVVHPTSNQAVLEDRFAPTFGGIYQENKKYKLMVYGMGVWRDFGVTSPDDSKNLVPAISLKVSK